MTPTDNNDLSPDRLTRSKMNPLAKLDSATRALAEARTLGEITHIRDVAEAARHYARAAQLGLEAQNHATEIRLRAERKAGEFLRDMPKSAGGRPQEKTGNTMLPVSEESKIPRTVRGISSRPPSLSDIGISKMQSSRWQQVARVPEPVFESYIKTGKESDNELTTAALLRTAAPPLDPPAKAPPLQAETPAPPRRPSYIVHNSGNAEWYTPAEYIEAARAVLGTIDLDPASCPLANTVVQAAAYFTADEDGLAHPWRGAVWLNPPYAAAVINAFAAKLIAEHSAGRVTAAVVLVNNATETGWFQTLAASAAAACFPTSRIRYWGPDGVKNTPLQGQALLYLGAHPDRFIDGFRAIGWCARIEP